MKLERVKKVVDDGMHNAVTDLARWRGRTWLCYRRADNHFNDPPGELRVLASEDLARWEPVGTISTDLDDRDPKLVPDGERLWLFFGAARVQEHTRWTESYASWTEDGKTWASPVRIFGPGWWLWRPAHFADGFWCAAYGDDAPAPEARQYVDLLRSDDGLKWSRVTRLLDDRQGNETALDRDADGRMRAFVRGRSDATWVLEADPPYESWTSRKLDHWLHAPAVARVGGRTILAGRDRVGEERYVTRLWEWRDGSTAHLLDLPSGGDTSYCGLVAPDDSTLLVSYYSQHEAMDRPGFRIGRKPAAVYVARLDLGTSQSAPRG